MLGFIKGNPWLAGAIGVALIVLIALGLRHIERGAVRREGQLQRQGAQEERLKQNEETINAVRQANDAVRDPDPGDVERMRAKYDRSRRADGP